MNIEEFKDSHKLISSLIYRTPLITNDTINNMLGRKVYFKCENLQLTGSFKIRGSLNSMLRGDKQPRITRSSGNFAQAMAWSGQKLQIPVTVVMPDNASTLKIQQTRNYGAEVILGGPTNIECDLKVNEILQQRNMRYTSTSNEKEVMLGQGTLALEVYEELPSVKHFVCAIGGGGLASGCATALKQLNPSINFVGVEPEGAQDYFISRKAGSIQTLSGIKTIADGLRAVCVGDQNWLFLEKYVDQVFLVSDQKIIEAMKLIFETTGMIVEPSAAISLACVLENLDSLNQGDIVCVISGGNIERDLFFSYIQ